MPLVVVRFPLSCGAERLTGARTCPNRSVIGPTCESEGVVPDGDPAEEMRALESSDIFGSDVLDGSVVDFSIGYESMLNEFAHPGAHLGVNVVIIGPLFQEVEMARIDVGVMPDMPSPS